MLLSFSAGRDTGFDPTVRDQVVVRILKTSLFKLFKYSNRWKHTAFYKFDKETAHVPVGPVDMISLSFSGASNTLSMDEDHQRLTS